VLGAVHRQSLIVSISLALLRRLSRPTLILIIITSLSSRRVVPAVYKLSGGAPAWAGIDYTGVSEYTVVALYALLAACKSIEAVLEQ